MAKLWQTCGMLLTLVEVECCDASTQCVFVHEGQDGSQQPEAQLCHTAHIF